MKEKFSYSAKILTTIGYLFIILFIQFKRNTNKKKKTKKIKDIRLFHFTQISITETLYFQTLFEG
jgi:hypothetical protein